MKYRIYDYDVWGNAEDGYEVNRVFRTNNVVEIKDTTSNDAIIRAALGDYAASDFDIDGDDHVIYITRADDGCPVCELRREKCTE